MSCKECSDNSSLTYSRCNPPISTNCVFYQGDSKEYASDIDFTICKGQNMSDVQGVIFDKVCSISDDLDVSLVNTDVCEFSKTTWDDGVKTISNLFDLSLELSCSLKTELTALELTLDTLDPIVSVDLCCCSASCPPPPTQRLSTTLTALVDCLCVTKSRADEAFALADGFSSQIATLTDQINNPTTGLNKKVTDLIAANMALQAIVAILSGRMNCVINEIGSSC